MGEGRKRGYAEVLVVAGAAKLGTGLKASPIIKSVMYDNQLKPNESDFTLPWIEDLRSFRALAQ